MFRLQAVQILPSAAIQADADASKASARETSLLTLGWLEEGLLVAAAVIVVALDHSLGGSLTVMGWVALAGTVTLVIVYHHRPRRPAILRGIKALTESPRARWLFAVLLALFWGSAPWWIARGSTMFPNLSAMLILGAVGALGAHALASNLGTSIAWPTMVLGPTIALSLAEPSPHSLATAALAACMLIAALIFALKRREHLLMAEQTSRSNNILVRQLRDQILLVERANLDKSRFLGAASHDLRQPMHALGLFAASLERSLMDSPLQPTVLHMMQAIDALEQSCSAMLDLSKLDAGVVAPNLQAFPVRDLFRRLHMHCAGQAEELGLGLRFKPGGKIVTSDPQLLERVLGNLVHNAIRYTPTGGVVVLARSRHDRICLEVWDTGVGIADDELPKIFDEFYQVGNASRDRSRGLGMGLAIVKRLLLLLGHELEVRSRLGRGTLFRILLAKTDLAEMENVVVNADTVPALVEMDRTALVVDDEESVRIGMRDLLTTWGFRVLLAGSIPEACLEVRRHAGVIDVVLSDLRLGNREDGIAAIARVREVYGAPLPAALITGDTSAGEVKRAHDSGHRVLFKPVRPRELYSLLRSLP